MPKEDDLLPDRFLVVSAKSIATVINSFDGALSVLNRIPYRDIRIIGTVGTLPAVNFIYGA